MARKPGFQTLQAAHLAALVGSSDDAIVTKTLDGIVTSWNRGAERIFGYDAAEMVGQSVRRLFPAHLLHQEDDILRRVSTGERVRHYETQRLRQDGSLVDVSITLSPIRDRHGAVIGVSKIARDVSDRLLSERRIAFEATHDTLTGLPNRRLLGEMLADAFGRSIDQDASPMAVLYVDLDGFKEINDSLGHAAGDRVLVQVTDRLKQAVRACDFIARIGGDEFIVLAPRLRSVPDVTDLGRRLMDALHAQITVDQHALNVSASIGVALYPQHGTDADELMRNADWALYRAKRLGRDRVEIYEPLSDRS